MKMKTILFAWLLTGIVAIGQGLTVGTNYSLAPSQLRVGSHVSSTNSSGYDIYVGRERTLDSSQFMDFGMVVRTNSYIGPFVDLELDETFASFILDWRTVKSNGASGAGHQFNMTIESSVLKFFATYRPLDVTSRTLLQFDLTAAATDPIAIIDSSITHSSGDMLKLYNNSTNVFAVDFKGGARVGSVTKAQKTAMGSVADGTIIYQTDNTAGFRVRIGGTWFILSTAADP